MRYLPSAPLLDAARAGRPWHLPVDCPYCDYYRAGLCITVKAVAEELGTTPETVSRWRSGQQVRTEHAEAFAHAIGYADHEVWPVLLEQANRPCAGCDGSFVPSRRGHVFCSEACRRKATRERERAHERNRYATDTEFREKKQAAARARREVSKRADRIKRQARARANADEMRAKRRARYEANRDAAIEYQRAYRARQREGNAA